MRSTLVKDGTATPRRPRPTSDTDWIGTTLKPCSASASFSVSIPVNEVVLLYIHVILFFTLLALHVWSYGVSASEFA
jgi:hypothetical protein